MMFGNRFYKGEKFKQCIWISSLIFKQYMNRVDYNGSSLLWTGHPTMLPM